MSTYDSTGVMMDRYADILADLISDAQTIWGTSVNTDDDELLGNFLRNMGELAALCNEAIQYCHDSHSVNNASGTMLDGLFSLLFADGRQDAAYSTVELTCTVTAATTIPAGSLVQTDANVIFATDEDLVFGGAGSDTVDATCTVEGAFNAAIGEVDTIVSSAYAWTTVTNAAAVIPGRLRETDAEYKVRHTNLISTTGLNDAASIYAAVEAVSGVSSVHVEEDEDDTSFNVIVVGGTDAAVAAAIDGERTTGIGTTGSESAVVNNATMGQNKTIYFDRASEVPIYIEVQITTDSSFPSDGEQQIKDAISALTHWGKISQDVIYTKLFRPIYGIAGVTVTDLFIGIAPSPSGEVDISIDTDEYSSIDDDDIEITIA